MNYAVAAIVFVLGICVAWCVGYAQSMRPAPVYTSTPVTLFVVFTILAILIVFFAVLK